MYLYKSFHSIKGSQRKMVWGFLSFFLSARCFYCMAKSCCWTLIFFLSEKRLQSSFSPQLLSLASSELLLLLLLFFDLLSLSPSLGRCCRLLPHKSQLCSRFTSQQPQNILVHFVLSHNNKKHNKLVALKKMPKDGRAHLIFVLEFQHLLFGYIFP